MDVGSIHASKVNVGSIGFLFGCEISVSLFRLYVNTHFDYICKIFFVMCNIFRLIILLLHAIIKILICGVKL